MPGNEFGERIHNFFEQEGISQDQHQSQVVDGSWSSFSNGLVGNQRQIDPSLIANLKNYSSQQSADAERGQSSNSQHGLNFTHQPIRSEYSRSLFQEHQQSTNGYMHGNLMLQAMPNEANFLGKDLAAKGFNPDPQKIPMRFEMGESPVNYDFFGGQQQLNSQLPGMLQTFPRQQMTFNDMQLLKQQVMVKQMQEYQLQQQLQKQQLEARQINSLNSNAVNGSRSSDNQAHPLINGIPLQDASSNCWQPDLMTGNTNWMHRGISPVVQGSSSGLMIAPEHGQTNLVAQQFEPSLYGTPVGGTNAPQNAFSSAQMNRFAAQHGSPNRSSSLTNQPIAFLNQDDVQSSHILPRSSFQEKLLLSHTSSPNNRASFETFQQDDSVQKKFGKMEGSGPSEKSLMEVPENINALQKPTTLDPTEEKILFGSDENLWDAFGNSTDMSLTGNLMSSSPDLYDACPSLQSGSWSALMQSAVAETSSDDTGVHANSLVGSRVQDLGVKTPNAPSERLHSDSTPKIFQHLHGKVSDHGPLEKSMAQRSQMAGNTFHSTSSGIDGQNNSCSIQKKEGIEDRLGIWKAASNPNLAALKEQKNHFTQNQQMQRASYGFGITGAGNDSRASKDVQGNIQQHLDKNSVEKAIPQLKSRGGSQILESYASNIAGSSEMVNARDLSMLPGGKETQSGHVGCRPSLPRKFQYHPMGNIDVTDEPSREKVPQFGQSKSFGQPAMNISIDKGHVSENSPSTSASADRSVDRCNQVMSASSRLELLHKVDQSQEHSLETNVSGRLRHSPSSASQGFSLQLAPPSQPAPSPDNVQFSRNSLQPMNTPPEKGGTSQSRFAPWASNQSFPQQSTYQGPGEPNMTSGFLYSKGYHQNQLMPLATPQSLNSSSQLSTPQVKERNECSDNDRRGHPPQTPSLLNPTTHSNNNKGYSAEGFSMQSASQPLVASSSSQQSSSSGMMSDSPASISAPQHRFWNQPSKPQSGILQPHPNNNVEGSFPRQEKTNQISSQNGGDVSLSGRLMVNMGSKQTSDDASMFSKMVQSNLQTFGRSLPSDNRPKDNLRHNEHMAGSGEGDAVDLLKVPPKGEQQSPSRSDGLFRDESNQKESSNHMLHFGQTVSHIFSNKNRGASAGADHQQISPQMAPRWYGQYGTFKNGLVQRVNDTGRFTPLAKSSTVGNSIDGSYAVQSSKQLNTADPGHVVHMDQMPVSASGTETPSSESLPNGATDKLLKIDKPKKRKTTATSGLVSWNKEVMQGLQRLNILGEAEVDWARATNRYAEKVEFETLQLVDGPPVRSKRRLMYTTQLMQQLFPPPTARVMSLAASSNYEFVAYTAARGALGDACSSTSTVGESCLPASNSIPLSERMKTEKINDHYISKAVEDFISRTQKLETDFAGLENGSTIVDLRVEVQDLERFAVINRFARFHPPSSSMDRTAGSLKLNPQRYVSIAPTPQNIPDRVQCLNL